MSRAHGGVCQTIDHKTAAETLYDVVIVGSGVSGAIMAHELSQQNLKVLVLEAGPGGDMTLSGYDHYLSTFYSAVSKDSNSPYVHNANAPMPRGEDIHKLQYGQPDTSSYVVQNGPFVLDGTYARVVGGTTMHWQGNVPRMLPEDFEMRSRFGQGLNWPIGYQALMPYYRKAEFEMGVSADVEDQAYHGIAFESDYVFPMCKMPESYLDRQIAKDLNGTEVRVAAESHSLKVRSIPQARNGIPNPKYNNGAGYLPVGAVSSHQAETGDRCQGNTNCTPICPVQAKYDARRTLAKAMKSGRVDLLTQTVAAKVHIDSETGRVTEIEYKTYPDLTAPEYTTGTVRGKTFVLAANAIENARLMLASGLPGSSGLMGRHLMNHVYMFAWGLMPEVAGAMRGTQGTSGIEELRGGALRAQQAAFHVDIANNGWTYATGSPYPELRQFVDNGNKYGAALRRELANTLSRQVLLAFMIEVPPDSSNRVMVDPNFTDQLGNLRPVVSYNVPDYSLNGAVFGRELSRRIFQRIGAEDHTRYSPLDFGYVNHAGQGITIYGGNHFSGTHLMGTTASHSVVDVNQQSWDHPNLYLVGSGSMPTIGTSNPTLTLAALCYKSVDSIVKDLS